ncbi:hypothetical protein Nepgr_031663 [Nepenthes gracilis]|uniref:Uncharacterized protein n=1 Tax=Nepenthes gracilis TaxID=150966 RepID=A0AAD3Y720_NEPGR|nr:hypothetical protein Nepgr_031663 [Nepenthes gracilis]
MQSKAAARGQLGVRKGSWTAEEDLLLRQCIEKYGQGNWHQIPQLSAFSPVLSLPFHPVTPASADSSS